MYTVGGAKLPLARPGSSLSGHVKADIYLRETASMYPAQSVKSKMISAVNNHIQGPANLSEYDWIAKMVSRVAVRPCSCRVTEPTCCLRYLWCSSSAIGSCRSA